MSFMVGQRVLILQNFKSAKFNIFTNENGKVISVDANGNVYVDFKQGRAVLFYRHELKQWLAAVGIRRVMPSLPPQSNQDSPYNPDYYASRRAAPVPSHQNSSNSPGYYASRRTTPVPTHQNSSNTSDYYAARRRAPPPSYQDALRITNTSPSAPVSRANVRPQTDLQWNGNARPSAQVLTSIIPQSSRSKPASKNSSPCTHKEEKKQESDEDERLICMICMDREKNMALIPCGHRFCSQCAQVLERCPMDRSVIKSRLRTFD